jgi:hypothetical protein
LHRILQKFHGRAMLSPNTVDILSGGDGERHDGDGERQPGETRRRFP